jgi:hypothetical protein
MATSRRNFLRVGTLCALGAGIPAVVSSAAAKSLGKTSGLANYRIQTFRPYLNTKFQIQGGPKQNIEVVLEKITDLKASSKNPSKIGGKESFSLLFKDTESTTRLAQRTYTIEHCNGEQFTLFIVPISKADSGYYEAVITTV